MKAHHELFLAQSRSSRPWFAYSHLAMSLGTALAGLAATDDASTASTSGSAAGAAALANLTTWVTWVKQSAAPLFTPPKRELPPGEDELRQVRRACTGIDRQGGRGQWYKACCLLCRDEQTCCPV